MNNKLDGCDCMSTYGLITCPRQSMGEITLYVTRMYGEDFTNIVHKSIRQGDYTHG